MQPNSHRLQNAPKNATGRAARMTDIYPVLCPARASEMKIIWNVGRNARSVQAHVLYRRLSIRRRRRIGRM